MPRYRRRMSNPFRVRRTRDPVFSSCGVQGKKRTKCAACAQPIEPGNPFVRLRLRARYRIGCMSCGHRPKGARRYHEACLPPETDWNKAMGFDPARAAFSGVTPPSVERPKPPKPATAEEAALSALASLESALVIRAQRKGVTPELEAGFKKFQAIKARVLRPGTPAEGEVATFLAIQQLVKLVFVS